MYLNHKSVPIIQHKYHHQCHDKDQYVDDIEEGNDYPGIPRECVKDPHCLVNTGDFRVVLADSHGDKIEEDLFGDLDEESHKWQGVQFRFHPSAYHRDLIHVSPGSHIPTSLYIRKKDGGLLSTNYMTKKHIWPGSFQVEPGQEETLTIKMLKKNSRDFMFSIEMNGYMFDYDVEFDEEDWVPRQIDTFAVAQPNLRGYTYLELRRP